MATPIPIQECINETYDKFYSYKKIIYDDKSVRYFFKGKDIHARYERSNRVANIVNFDKNNPKLTLSYYFPDWFEAGVETKTYETNYYGNNPEGISGPSGFYYWNKISGDAIKTRVKNWICEKIDQEPISNKDGDIDYELPQFTLEPRNASILIQKEGYQNIEINPYTQGGDLTSLPVIELKDNQTALNEEITKTNELSSDQVEELLKDKKSVEWFSQQRIAKITTEKLQKVLIPMILTPIIMKFGVSNPIDLLSEIQNIKNTNKIDPQQQILDLIDSNIGNISFCPSPEELKIIIKLKNDATVQINQVMTLLNVSTKILGVNVNLIDAFEALFQILKFSPIPIPPLAPVSLVGLIEDAKEFADKDIIKKLGTITTGTLAILLVTRQVLTQILQLLDLLDRLIQLCSPETVEYEQEIASELNDLLNQQQVDNFSPPITIINGFKMEIETETTEEPLKRRRAIARDAKGVTVLKGEWSFSSAEQILIDELVFYIQSNDLKSN